MQTSTLPLPRRVQLAVVAHIRHIYTDYDKLLRKVPYQAARSMVEPQTLVKLAEWRGEAGDEPDEMEDILREVIVISEDEDDELPIAASKGDGPTASRDSVEIVSMRPIQDQVETRPIDYGSQQERERSKSRASDDLEDITFIGHGQYFIDKADHERSKRDEARRFAAWEEARGRFRRPQHEQRTIIAAQPQPFEHSGHRHADDVRHESQHVSDSTFSNEARKPGQNEGRPRLREHERPGFLVRADEREVSIETRQLGVSQR